MGQVDLTGKSVLTSLIDADSIIYIVAWKNKEENDIDKVLKEVDQFIVDILFQTQARQYAGFFTPKHYFRYDIAKFKPYKGNRGDNPEWVTRWKPYIISHLEDKWGFVMCVNMEADDAVSIIQQSMLNTTICSPDKDLKQVPGNHFDYKTGTKVFVTDEQARRSFWYQMIVGDSSDNITGYPGMGEKAADRLLSSGSDSNEWKQELKQLFDLKYPGLFWETYRLVRMLCPWDLQEGELNDLMEYSIRTFDLDSAVPSDYLAEKDNEGSEKTEEDPFKDPFSE